jgi:hypothetical protein
MRDSLEPRALARIIGTGRVLLGGAFLAAPVASTRALGLDSATAKRVSFLARMMAARDVAIGAGTAAASCGGGRPGGWLLAGAFADAADAVVIVGALKNKRANGPIAAGVVGGAVALAAVAAVGGLSGLRRRG